MTPSPETKTMTENTTDQRLQTVAEGIANIVGAPYEDWRHFTGEAKAILSRLDNVPTPAADEVEAVGWLGKVTTDDERERLLASLNNLRSNPSTEEVPLVLEEVIAILRGESHPVQDESCIPDNQIHEAVRSAFGERFAPDDDCGECDECGRVGSLAVTSKTFRSCGACALKPPSTITAMQARSAEPPTDAREAVMADLLTKAIGDITAALILAGKKHKIAKWTAPYVEALNEYDAAEPAGEKPGAKTYTLKVLRHEDYSGEHREWTETYTLPRSLVEEIQKDARPATPTNPERLVEQKAAEAIRKAFFTSVSGGSPQYHLSLAYQSIDEMHEAEDAIKAWAKSVLEPKA